MKLENKLILTIIEAGGRTITANSIDDADSAFAVIKFRQSLTKAFAALKSAEMTLISECNLKADGRGNLTGGPADKKRFCALEQKLLSDTSDLGEITPIPYKDWHSLKKENKGLANAEIEDALENLMWLNPEKQKKK